MVSVPNVRAAVLPSGTTRVWTVAPDGTRSRGRLHTVEIDTEALGGLLAAFTRSCADQRCQSASAAWPDRRDPVVEALIVDRDAGFSGWLRPPVLGSIEATRVVIGHLELDPWSRETRSRGRIVELTAKEFDLLLFLATRPGQVFSRDELLRDVWKSSSDWQQTSTVTEHVRRLRTKIELDGQHPQLLRTVRGAGYRFDLPCEPRPARPEGAG